MTASPHPAPEVGAVLDGEFRLDRALGRGMMGTVYQATWLSRAGQPEVAVKVLAKRWVEHEQTTKRFQREGEILARLDHPNLLRMHRLAVSDDGAPYLVTELVKGKDLRAVLASEWPLAPARLHAFARQLFSGLGYAHTTGGVVHRDIKPDNVLIADGGDVLKIVDFGISKSLYVKQTALTDQRTVLGSPAYMAPEQIVGKPGTWSDLYSAGCLLYECLTGKTLFAGRKVQDIVAAHLKEEPRWPQVDGARLDGPLVELTMRCLSKHPEERAPSAHALVDELQRMTPETCVTGYPTGEPADGALPATVMLMPAAQPREATLHLPQATLTLHRAALRVDALEDADQTAEIDARAFQSVPMWSPEVLDAMPKPTQTQALKVGYMEPVPSGMWLRKDAPSKYQPPPATKPVGARKKPAVGASWKVWVGVGVGVLLGALLALALLKNS